VTNRYPHGRNGDGDPPDRTRELRPPTSGQREAVPGEQAPEATALIDATSMEGLQERSRRGGSIPPPPASDAQMTSVLDTSKLSELVVESGPGAPRPESMPDSTATVRPPGVDARPVAAASRRAKYTPTLRSADFDEQARGKSTRLWPLFVGMLVLGAGVGTFMGARTLPSATADATVELIVRAEPGAATFQLDNEPLAGNPHTSTRPRDGKRRTIIVKAPGHETERIDVVFDASSTIDVVLSKSSPPR
jgi:hypothetical protein